MSSWIDLSIINSIFSGGILLVLICYAYGLYSALWKEELRKQALLYISTHGLEMPTSELEYLRPILKYNCRRNTQSVELTVKGGFLGVRFIEQVVSC